MESNEFLNIYWKQYIALEKEFNITTQYVTIDSLNESTFSNAYVKLILQLGSEIDAVAKVFCTLLNENFEKSLIDKETNESRFPDIKDYRRCICENESRFSYQEVKVLNLNMSLRPWANWQESAKKKKLDWWLVYNAVKHDRMGTGQFGNPSKQNYKYANFKHTLNSLAALYQLNMHIYLKLAIREKRRITVPIPGSKLFAVYGDMWKDIELYSSGNAFYLENGSLINESGNFAYD